MKLSNERPFIAGNWKMYKTVPEAMALVKAIKEKSSGLTGAELVVIPPFTALSDVRRAIEGSSVQLGAQNLFWEKEGAYTGEVSAAMIKSSGCRYAVIGHSERRQYFGETDETVNKKIKSALAHELIPIVCIGESLAERENGKTMEKVESQIHLGLEGLNKDEVRQLVLAYEPIWAIGTGKTAAPEQAEEVHSFIRDKMAEKYGQETASCAIILYGGSVKAANAYSLLREKNINGALVGGASLEAESFIHIAKEAIRAYKEKT